MDKTDNAFIEPMLEIAGKSAIKQMIRISNNDKN